MSFTDLNLEFFERKPASFVSERVFDARAHLNTLILLTSRRRMIKLSCLTPDSDWNF